MLKNGAFTDGWTDMPPAQGYLINQQPNGWTLTWIDPGEALYGSGDKAKGVPECVHKLASQLPPNEQLGASEALILEGDTTYKIFHYSLPFGAELRQTVRGLASGSQAKLVVPILADLHDDTDPYAAESGAWVDTVGSDNSDDWVGEWANASQMGDRNWYRHELAFTVPASGEVTVYIRVKSKWARSKDFFIDGIRLDAVAGEATPPPPDDESPPSDERVVTLIAPAEMNVVVTGTSGAADTITVQLPDGVRLVVKDS